jgi:hypothetical protein
MFDGRHSRWVYESHTARTFALLGLLAACACSAAKSAPQQQSDGGDQGDTPGTDSSNSGATQGFTDAGTAMPLISRNVPVYVSSNDGQAAQANNNQVLDTWSSTGMPAWIAYDLSEVPSDQRQTVLVAWYALHSPDYIAMGTPDPDTGLIPDPDGQKPIDYTIETNAGAGGGSPPDAGWTQRIAVTGNDRNTRQHLIGLNGANWVRMSMTRSSSANVSIDLDIQSAPHGASDSWLFMGDSITHFWAHRGTPCLTSQFVQEQSSQHWPAMIEDGISGKGSTDAVGYIDQHLEEFPGAFVVLSYGTNGGDLVATGQALDTLVQKVLAAGKIPVIPHMPWSHKLLSEGPTVNAEIDALYAKYPQQLVPGPDLWSHFENHTEWIPADDVHPTSAGMTEFQHVWADFMVSYYSQHGL